MCFTKNLRFIRTLPEAHKPHMFAHSAAYLDDFRRKIVLKAMYKHYPADVVDEVKAQRRSELSTEALYSDFLKNEQPKVRLVRDQHYKKALSVMTKLFKPEKLYKPIAFPDLRYYPWNLSVSAEVPYTTHNFWNSYLRNKHFRKEILDFTPTFHNLFDELFLKNRHLAHLIKRKDQSFFDKDGTPIPYYWVSLHARSHVVGPDDEDKIRAVFGVPKLLLMIENMFIWPMQADLLNRDPHKSPMLWGCEIMKGGWKRLRNIINRKTGGKFRTVISADWSQFDRRALFDIIDDVHDTWHDFYDWSGDYQPTNFYPHASTDPQRFENLWTWFTHNVKHYPIATPEGLFQWTRNGIASGYQETQLLDSWVNGIMLLTTLSELGIDIEHEHFFIKLQGDDSIVAFSEGTYRLYGKRFLNRMSVIAMRRFNAKLSVDKSDIHGTLDGVYVLGYYNTSGIAWRTDVDLLSHLLFPERSQTLGATASSALGIAMAAMGCSEQVYLVCRDVYDFITMSLKVEREDLGRLERNKYQYLYGAELPMLFPSFQTTYLQNYILDGRSESQRQRTWPTDPQYTGGFHFL